MGFLLNWTAPNCSTCERRGGRFGFENNELIFFFRDRPHPKSCDDGTSLNVGRKVAIGLGAALGTLVTMLIAVFWYRRKKRQYESIFSRSIKSVPIFLKKKHNQDLELDDGFELNDVTNAEQSDIVRQIAIVGLWCILTNPSDRPSMRKVIEMLEGPLGALKIPPKPRLSPSQNPPLCSSVKTQVSSTSMACFCSLNSIPWLVSQAQCLSLNSSDVLDHPTLLPGRCKDDPSLLKTTRKLHDFVELGGSLQISWKFDFVELGSL
ncbi:hypothetical protein D5086_028072 [Populus alba]|uniref:Uncharacterized protein n=1 Tax=Populus alba TaxID=43335 RepID=A0ACC4AXC1_POPAL